MKKEIFVGGFLILMLVAAFVNIHFLNKLTRDVSALIDASASDATRGDWDNAAQKAEQAASKWSDSDTYTHLVLRHSELEATTDALYAYLTEVYAHEDGAVKGAAIAAKARLESISSIENVRLGSIF